MYKNDLPSGWHAQAVVVPPYKERAVKRRFALAVLGQDGAPVVGSTCNLQRKQNTGFQPDPSYYAEDVQRLSGRWLFGGFFQPHFGHQITQCLGRLPWLEQVGDVDGILFAGLPKAARQAENQKPFKALMELAAPGVPVRVAVRPTEVERLFVGQSQFAEFTDCVPQAGFVAWAQKRFAQVRAKTQKGRKLYVSRHRLDPLLGRVLCEDLLEDNLRRLGFEVFYPEEHTLSAQLRAYSEAELILTTDGTAAHMIAFMQNPNQKVVVIARRIQKPIFIHNHLIGFQPAEKEAHPAFVNRIIREWQLPGDNRLRVRSELDFAGLFDDLAKLGVLPLERKSEWMIPDKTHIEASKAFGCPEGAMLAPIEVGLA